MWLLPSRLTSKRAPFFRLVVVTDLVLLKLLVFAAYGTLQPSWETFMLISTLLFIFVVELMVLFYSLVSHQVTNSVCRSLARVRWWCIVGQLAWWAVVGGTLLATEAGSKSLVLAGLFPLLLLNGIVNLDLSNGLCEVTKRIAREELDDTNLLL